MKKPNEIGTIIIKGTQFVSEGEAFAKEVIAREEGKEQERERILKLISKWYDKYSYTQLTYNKIHELNQKIKEEK